MAHPIEKKIVEREAQIADIDRQMRQLEMTRATLSAEVSAYRDTLQYLNPSPTTRSRRVAVRASAGRGISRAWAGLLAEASTFGTEDFTIDDIVAAGRRGGQDLKRPSVRTQAANMVTRGVLERVTPGSFRVTPDGWAEICAADVQNENGEAEASPDAEQDTSLFNTPNPAPRGA